MGVPLAILPSMQTISPSVKFFSLCDACSSTTFVAITINKGKPALLKRYAELLTALYVKYNVLRSTTGTPHSMPYTPDLVAKEAELRPPSRPTPQAPRPGSTGFPTPPSPSSWWFFTTGLRSSSSTTGTPSPITPTASLSPSSPHFSSGTKERFSKPLPSNRPGRGSLWSSFRSWF